MLNARTARGPTVEEDVAEALALLRRQSEQRARAVKGAQGDEGGIASREMRLMSAAGARDGAAAGAGFAPLAGAMANGGGTAHARFWPGVNEVAAGRPVPAARVMPDRSAPLQPQFIPGLGELMARRVQRTAASQPGGEAQRGASSGAMRFGAQRQAFLPTSSPAGGASPIAAAPAGGTSLSARTAGGRSIAPHANAPAVSGQRTRDPQLWRPARMQAPEIGPPMDPGTGTSSTLQGSRRLREAMPGVAEALDPEVERAPARRRLDPARPEGPALPRIMVRRTRRNHPGWNRYAPNINDMDAMDLRDVDEIVFHHTGNERTPQDVERLHRMGQEEVSWARDFASWARGDDRPPYRWGDIGYHYMIAEDGTVYEGRNARYEGSHAAKRGGNWEFDRRRLPGRLHRWSVDQTAARFGAGVDSRPAGQERTRAVRLQHARRIRREQAQRSEGRVWTTPATRATIGGGPRRNTACARGRATHLDCKAARILGTGGAGGAGRSPASSSSCSGSSEAARA